MATFGSSRSGTQGGWDIWRAERDLSGFANVTNVIELNSPMSDAAPVLSLDRLTVYFATSRNGDLEIWRARRQSTADALGAPSAVLELDTPGEEYPGWLSADGCRLYINRDNDAMVATRSPAR